MAQERRADDGPRSWGGSSPLTSLKTSFSGGHDIMPKHGAAILCRHAGHTPLALAFRITPMLAEKFIILLETMRSQKARDGAPRVVSTSPHIPVRLELGSRNDNGAPAH